MTDRRTDALDVTDVTIILDRSGSMDAIRSDVIGGFNGFLADQRRLLGYCHLALVQFDDEYEIVYAGRSIADAPDLTRDTFQPRGSTALLDAIGRSIRETDRRLEALAENHRPRGVLVAIVTDGLENASTDYKRDRVLEMIKTHTHNGWTFLFLAANQDAISEGERVGIAAQQSLNFTATGQGIHAGTLALSQAVSGYRSTGSASFRSPRRRRPKVH